MTRALGALVTALLLWWGVMQPVQAAVTPARDAVGVTCTYDGHHTSAHLDSTFSDRGPPASYDRKTTYDTVGPWLRGSSAGPSGPSLLLGYAYDHSEPHVLEASVASLVVANAGVARGDVSRLNPTQVATNAAPPRFITTGAGTTIDRLAVNTTISAQRQGRHVLGARQYGGGSYFNSADDAQGVLDAFHSGSAQVLGTKGNDIVVRVPGITGFNHNPGAGFPNQATNVFFIKGSSSPSVVPYNPAWKP